jgi:sporulation protein YlmC with PRC-barrel domain
MTGEHRFNIKLGDLLRRPVTDADGIRVGYVEDVWLEDNGSIWLVAGGNPIQELLARLHIRPDIDLLVPSDAIESITDRDIELKWTMFQLESTCEECWVREKERLVRAAAHPEGNVALHLISRGLWGFEPKE